MTEQRFELDGLTITVRDEGPDEQPWGGGLQGTRYNIRVEANEGTYESKAWGSQHDLHVGKLDHEGIGFMILGELLSAAYDPGEFYSLATDDEEHGPAESRFE